MQNLNFHIYIATVSSFQYLRMTWLTFIAIINLSSCHYLSVHSPHPSLGGVLYELHPGPGVGLQAGPGNARSGVGLGGADQLQGQLRVVRQVQLVHCHTGSVWNIHKSTEMFFMNVLLILDDILDL